MTIRPTTSSSFGDNSSTLLFSWYLLSGGPEAAR